jgi:hypothetical protein
MPHDLVLTASLDGLLFPVPFCDLVWHALFIPSTEKRRACAVYRIIGVPFPLFMANRIRKGDAL